MTGNFNSYLPRGFEAVAMYDDLHVFIMAELLHRSIVMCYFNIQHATEITHDIIIGFPSLLISSTSFCPNLSVPFHQKRHRPSWSVRRLSNIHRQHRDLFS